LKPLTLLQIADLAGGVIECDTNVADLEITGAATARHAKAGEIAIFGEVWHSTKLEDCKASALLVSDKVETADFPVVRVPNAHAAFTKVVEHFRPARPKSAPSISSQAVIAPSAKLGKNVTVHPLAVIGEDVIIGDGCTIHSGVAIMAGCDLDEDVTVFPNAVLYENTIVGPRCIIHANAVIGAHGFGYESSEKGHVLSAQLGNVILGADVDVGACSAVDAGTYDATLIGEGTKIDNFTQVAHNCDIGKHNILCSQVGIAGSTTTGDFVVMGGRVGVRDHVHIGAGASIGAGSGVPNSIPAGEVYLGYPARPLADAKRIIVSEGALPQMRKQLKELIKKVEKLQNKEA